VAQRTQKPRVLHIIDKLETGGAERSLLNLCRRINRRRFDVRVCALRGATVISEQLQQIGIPVQCLGLKRWSPVQLAAVAKVVRAHKPGLLHLHLVASSLLGGLVGACSEIPIVCTDQTADWLERNQPVLAKLVPPFRIGLAKRFSKIIAVSGKVRDYNVSCLKAPPGKVVVIPNGIEVEEFANASPSPFFEECKVGPATPVVGTVGRMVPEKAQTLLVEAAARLIAKHPDLKLVIVGDGPLRSEIIEKVRSMRVESHVLLAGRRQDVPGFLCRFNVFALPSASDCMPLALLEAMAAQCPVVATRVGGIPEVVEHGVTGLLVPPAEPEALAATIENLLTDRKLANQFAINGRQLVEEKFSAEAMARRIEAVYCDVLGIAEDAR